MLDRKWREHLYEMDYLKQGIGLRAMAQRDPLIEYQREGFDMFATMLEALKEECVGLLFNLPVEQPEPPQESDAAALPAAADRVGRAQRAAQAAQQAARGGSGRRPRRSSRRTSRRRCAARGSAGRPAAPDLQRPGRGRRRRVQGGAQRNNGDSGQGGGSASRRDRRAAARDAEKKGKKGPRR